MLYRLWLRLLGLDRVSGVLKNFHRTITKLENVKKHNAAECERYARIIRTAEVGREIVQQEAAKAGAVAAKLRSIVS